MSQKTYPEDMLPIELNPSSPFYTKGMNQVFDERLAEAKASHLSQYFLDCFDGNTDDLMPLLHAVFLGSPDADKHLRQKLTTMVEDNILGSMSEKE